MILQQSKIIKKNFSRNFGLERKTLTHKKQKQLFASLSLSCLTICASGFSTLLQIKSKQRNKFDVKDNLRCAVSQTKPHIPLL